MKKIYPIIFISMVVFFACSKENWRHYTPPAAIPYDPSLDPPPVVEVPKGDTLTFKVMSVGILHSSASLSTFAHIIDSAGVDLVFLREVDNDNNRSGKGVKQGEDLANLVHMNQFFAKAQDYQTGQYGVSILSKYPIASTYTQIFPTNRPVAMISFKIQDTINVYFAGVQFDDVTTAAGATNRVAQATALLDVTKNITDGPMILAGNFFIQTTPSTDPTITVLKAQFTSACDTCGYTSPATGPNVIADHVLYKAKPGSTAVNVLSYKVLGYTPVTALPVISEIQFVQ
ncbi:MAG: hypothetical protein QM727_06005 [Niabella sp.]